MHIRTSSLLTAITIGLAPFACTVEDDPTSEEILREEALESSALAVEDYFECQSESDDCSSEEEDLVEALQDLELVDDNNGFRAIAIAECTGRQHAICSGAGTCYATDDVGCACQNNGVLSFVMSCSQAPPL